MLAELYEEAGYFTLDVSKVDCMQHLQASSH